MHTCIHIYTEGERDMKIWVGEKGGRNSRPTLAFRKNFLQRCDILLHGDRDREVYTEYPCCYCRIDCLSSEFGFESVAIGFGFLFPHNDPCACCCRRRRIRWRMCGLLDRSWRLSKTTIIISNFIYKGSFWLALI